AFKVRGKFLSRLREDDVLVLKPVDDIEQQFLMSTAPEAFFLTNHYRGFTAILVRLSAVDRAQLQDLIEQAWSRLAGKKRLAAHAAIGGR
ncbi:MAG TPA: MmcQ/YjbR family DNA-binding protein, partial [Dehalococcoidia bacterium]|nr:MmcQ/YjbR family DNA-binding protein [Dehalococcoidia bacterium]